MRIIALDLGDRWTGIARSDQLRIIAQPHKTVETSDLDNELKNLFTDTTVQTVVIGLPITMRGTESQQTKKVITEKENFEKKFPNISWILWDERRTSKQAASLKKIKTKEDKLRSHSIAAAIILQSYLDSLHLD